MCPADQIRFIAQPYHILIDPKSNLMLMIHVCLCSDIESDNCEEDAAPISESQAASLLVGRMRGIQGHFNSCYLDATLFR